MSSEPSISNERGMHCGLGYLQRKNNTIHTHYVLLTCLSACLPLSLHFEMAQGQIRLPAGQQGLGIPEIWSLNFLVRLVTKKEA